MEVSVGGIVEAAGRVVAGGLPDCPSLPERFILQTFIFASYSARNEVILASYSARSETLTFSVPCSTLVFTFAATTFLTVGFAESNSRASGSDSSDNRCTILSFLAFATAMGISARIFLLSSTSLSFSVCLIFSDLASTVSFMVRFSASFPCASPAACF